MLAAARAFVSVPGVASGGSLLGSIGELARELAEMKQRLAQAHSEIARLSQELGRSRRAARPVSPEELQVLRRRVAFYCHPDRGGDGELMSRLNRLFDALEREP